MQWFLDVVVVLLLAATLFHAIRLERALGVLKRDRAELEILVASFNSSTREAQDGIERLRVAADTAARAIVRQTEAATMLRDDLSFLIERGEKLADRLDHSVRAGRVLAPEQPAYARPADASEWGRANLPEPTEAVFSTAPVAAGPTSGSVTARVRSRAERDLLAALRMAR